jgi:hypothetical protein
MRVTRCFSFDPVKDKLLLDYIDKSANASAEIRELLKLKLELGDTDNDVLVEKIVQGVISKLGTVPVVEPVTPKKTTKSDIDLDDMNSIKSIIKMR